MALLHHSSTDPNSIPSLGDVTQVLCILPVDFLCWWISEKICEHLTIYLEVWYYYQLFLDPILFGTGQPDKSRHQKLFPGTVGKVLLSRIFIFASTIKSRPHGDQNDHPCQVRDSCLISLWSSQFKVYWNITPRRETEKEPIWERARDNW